MTPPTIIAWEPKFRVSETIKLPTPKHTVVSSANRQKKGEVIDFSTYVPEHGWVTAHGKVKSFDGVKKTHGGRRFLHYVEYQEVTT